MKEGGRKGRREGERKGERKENREREEKKKGKNAVNISLLPQGCVSYVCSQDSRDHSGSGWEQPQRSSKVPKGQWYLESRNLIARSFLQRPCQGTIHTSQAHALCVSE